MSRSRSAEAARVAAAVVARRGVSVQTLESELAFARGESHRGCAATQTDDSELLAVSGIVDLYQQLHDDLQIAREDLDNARLSVHIRQQDQIEAKIAELYADLGDQVAYYEKRHASKLEILRGSYTQQMRNALAQQAGQYAEELARVKTALNARHTREVGALNTRLAEYKSRLQRKENVAEKLKERLKHQESELSLHQIEVASLEKSLGEAIEALRRSDEIGRVLPAMEREMTKKDDMVADLARRIHDAETRCRKYAEENAALKVALDQRGPKADKDRDQRRTGMARTRRNTAVGSLPGLPRAGRRGSRVALVDKPARLRKDKDAETAAKRAAPPPVASLADLTRS